MIKFETKLQNYEEPRFLSLVQEIWNADTDKAHHDALIAHFDRVVGHRAGSDLLFYPEPDEAGSINSPDEVVATLKRWYLRQGRAAFKGQVLPSPASHQPLTREQRAVQASNRNLEQSRKLIADIQSATQRGAHTLKVLEQQLAIEPSAGTPEQQLSACLGTLRNLESAQIQAQQALAALENLEVSVQFAVSDAARNVSSPFFNVGIQTVVLKEITPVGQHYAAALAAARQQHPALYQRGAARIESLESHIAQLTVATDSGPGRGPLTLRAPLHSAGLHPALLTVQGLSREVARQQHRLTQTFQSALAELQWQAAASLEDHPGIYVDVLQFVLGAPSDDPRFAVSVPLAALYSEGEADWQGLAKVRGDIQMPFRMCTLFESVAGGPRSFGVKPHLKHSHVLLTTTQGSRVPSRVPVRMASWQAAHQAWAYSGEGRAPVTVLWQQGDAPYAAEDSARPASISFLSLPSVPLVGTFANLERLRFDDCIVVFPAESGLEPLYLMLRDRRELPGGA
ncbi:S-type pyocin domain-containing protein [Pseudomonas plecoglossicida]|uniref:S-type pyocin domain-containing protein n=1 Tax=Pseudomonas plecoglossicida TaxID=70775 RepID=UPI000AABB550|nr:S-type pyocin domain-containing protein [Pseudomonas plecoglossicida]GLR35723.1 hypothetical protein GCM10011247_11200 [Pseudomonas plecoglossicida]